MEEWRGGREASRLPVIFARKGSGEKSSSHSKPPPTSTKRKLLPHHFPTESEQGTDTRAGSADRRRRPGPDRRPPRVARVSLKARGNFSSALTLCTTRSFSFLFTPVGEGNTFFVGGAFGIDAPAQVGRTWRRGWAAQLGATRFSPAVSQLFGWGLLRNQTEIGQPAARTAQADRSAVTCSPQGRWAPGRGEIRTRSPERGSQDWAPSSHARPLRSDQQQAAWGECRGPETPNQQ